MSRVDEPLKPNGFSLGYLTSHTKYLWFLSKNMSANLLVPCNQHSPRRPFNYSHRELNMLYR